MLAYIHKTALGLGKPRLYPQPEGYAVLCSLNPDWLFLPAPPLPSSISPRLGAHSLWRPTNLPPSDHESLLWLPMPPPGKWQTLSPMHPGSGLSNLD